MSRPRGTVLLLCDTPVRLVLDDGKALEGVVLTLDPETALVYVLSPPGEVTVFAHADCESAETLLEDHELHKWWNELQDAASEKFSEKQLELSEVDGLDDVQRKNLASLPLRKGEQCIDIFAENILQLKTPVKGPQSCVAPKRGVDARLENMLFADIAQVSASNTASKNKKKAKPTKNPSNTVPLPKAATAEVGVLCYDGFVELNEKTTLFKTSVNLPRYSSFAPQVTNIGVGEYDPSSGVPRKYFAQRYRLFSRFDDGVQLDEESWYSVTPEAIAEHIAERCRCEVIVDAFAGAGGNAIQFAFTCERVIAIEIDRAKLEMARHNARVYGVDDRIEFIHGDALQILHMLERENVPVDAIFISPPWGGPTYQNVDSFLLEHIQVGKYDGAGLYHAAARVTPNVAMFVPRNTALEECILFETDNVEFEQHVIDERVKTCSIYTGDLLAARTIGLQKDIAVECEEGGTKELFDDLTSEQAVKN
mmetsp:Transcript_11360/g.22202  ORF Transcript_11360/g.22202 Transcript_11360/m.22202 type:complete len:480 (+) Transcript_11360:63-1502(+)|eukprot:CAMPEP_0171568200 /NCGR_PEP_ID=MMETSP0961-20121227/1614_1 /TAXON_ID=87120 /ORGANISM="Aurantiochytrium limacinum, Strain ATCCMYA-1381" /LENGTH=479 /DNA_ID=CAMNT_0012122267 /DNA_START=35 /DNA_END=1474 /DNA_ORIENTATION=+